MNIFRCFCISVIPRFSNREMSRLNIIDLPLSGIKLICRNPIGDSRGFLCRLFCADELSAGGWTKPISQINHTLTMKRGAVRGMHFQYPPFAEMKLVTCIRGAVWDVVVDVRAESPTFLHWHAEVLSRENCRAMLIPEGFAHGFQVFTDESELIYCHSSPYNPKAEAGLNPKDPRIAIGWPCAITELSEKDERYNMVDVHFRGVFL